MPSEKKPKKKTTQKIKNEISVENILAEFEKEVKLKKEVESTNIDTLLPSTEPKVDMLNKYWKKINDNIEEYINYDQKTFLVDVNIFNMTKEQLEKFKTKNEESYKIYKFYKLHDNVGTQCIITSTLNTIYGCFCADVSCNMFQDTTNKSKFHIFKNAGATEIYVTPLKFIRTKMTKGVNAELEKIRTLLESQHSVNFVKEVNTVEVCNSRCKIVEQLLKKIKNMVCSFNLPKKKYYIQKIYLSSEQNKCYVMGSYEKLKQLELVNFVFNNCVDIDNPTKHNLKVEVVKEVEIQVNVEGLLYLDCVIEELDTIKNGLNKFYNIFQNSFLEKSVIMHVKYELLFNKYCLLNVGTGEYIVNAKIKDMNYVYRGVGNNAVEGLEKFYLMTNHNELKDDKIIKMLFQTDLHDISIMCVKRNIDKKNIDKELCVVKNLFPKETLLNYDIANDEHVNQKEFKKEIANVKSLVFSSKYKK